MVTWRQAGSSRGSSSDVGVARRAATPGRGGATAWGGRARAPATARRPVGSSGSCPGSPPPPGRRRRPPPSTSRASAAICGGVAAPGPATPARPSGRRRWRDPAPAGRPGPSPATVTTSKPIAGEGVGPGGGHDRDAVGAAEAERQQGAGGHRLRGGCGAGERARPGHGTGRGRGGPRRRPGRARGQLAPTAGYTVPNGAVYPFQWLWDSCFHAVVWAALGEGERARSELAHLFRTQDELGFVPHVDYEPDPAHHARSGGGAGQSSITQPPMYGHAVAELARRGIDVDDLVEPARRGLRFLLERAGPRRGAGRAVPPVGERGRRLPPVGPLVPRGLGPGAVVRGEGRAGGDRRARARTAAPARQPGLPRGRVRVQRPRRLQRRGSWPAVTGDEAARHRRRRAGRRPRPAVGRRGRDLGRRRRLRARARAGCGPSTRCCRCSSPTGRRPSRRGSPSWSTPPPWAGRAGRPACTVGSPPSPRRTYWRGPAWPQLTYLVWVAASRRGRSEAAALAAMLVEGARPVGLGRVLGRPRTAPGSARRPSRGRPWPRSWSRRAERRRRRRPAQEARSRRPPPSRPSRGAPTWSRDSRAIVGCGRGWAPGRTRCSPESETVGAAGPGRPGGVTAAGGLAVAGGVGVGRVRRPGPGRPAGGVQRGAGDADLAGEVPGQRQVVAGVRDGLDDRPQRGVGARRHPAGALSASRLGGGAVRGAVAAATAGAEDQDGDDDHHHEGEDDQGEHRARRYARVPRRWWMPGRYGRRR